MEEDIHAPATAPGAADRCSGRGLPRHQPLRAARTGTRLLLERHIRRPGHHRHLRGQALRPGRRPGDDRLRPLPVPGPVPAVRRPDAHQLLGPHPRRPDARGLRDADHPAHQAGGRHRPGEDPGPALRLHEAPRHLLPRGRSVRARLRRLQQPEQDAHAPGLHAGGEPHLLHVQLVLRRQQAHRLLQLRRQPRAAEQRRPEPSDVRQETPSCGRATTRTRRPRTSSRWPHTRTWSTRPSSRAGTTGRRRTTTRATRRSSGRSCSTSGSSPTSPAPRRSTSSS